MQANFKLIKEALQRCKQKIICLTVFSLMVAFSGNHVFAQAIPAKTIPDFTFYSLKNNQPFTQKQLRKEGKILFLFFDATCPHCQYEMQQLG